MPSNTEKALKRILVVCSGNTCRSPMLAAMLNALFTLFKVPAVAESAGLREERLGAPASDEAIKTMTELGISIRNHIARYIWEVKDLSSCDYILVMEGKLRQNLLDLEIGIDPTIVEVVNEAGGGIPNPYHKGLDAYRNARKLLAMCAMLFTGKIYETTNERSADQPA